MLLRSAVTAQDPVRIERLVARTGVFNAKEVKIARSLVEETLSRGTAAGYEFLFADGEQSIDGYSCFGPIPGTDRRYELYWIAVDPHVQKIGLARALLAATEKAVASRGAVRLFAETSGLPSYAPAHALYKRSGFRLIATIPDYHADGDSLFVFEKML